MKGLTIRYRKTGLELSSNRLCLLEDHSKHFFVKLANQNFPSVTIFVLRETTKFLFPPQARQLAYILIQKVFNWTLFSCLWIEFWPQTHNWELTVLPHAPWLLEILSYFSWVTFKKIIRTLKNITNVQAVRKN